jgi:CheY-like chemotaxis protein
MKTPSCLIEILLVEDNPGDVRLTREALKEGRIPSHLSVATSGEDALSFLRRQGEHAAAPRPNLILLDLNLPGMSGREVLGTIKQDAALKAIPVVILTSSHAELDVVKSYSLHANCYISKPLELDRFVAVVRAIEDFWLMVARLPPQGEACHAR